ncbi:MAG TPA: 16S rRNA (cytosine(1402)-N(4))-methyltransferase RsmH [Gemmatimonadales bacterium]|jgi:16S rRNA (cytosine1402-N4)-methyltransferase
MTYHDPVLAGEIARLAEGKRRAVDGTLGGGGHSALLAHAGATVLGIDRDPEALAAAQGRLDGQPVRFLEGGFGDEAVLDEIAAFHPDFVLLDLGVSSRQLDEDTRGFSFRRGVPLDMRMSGTGATAADLLTHTPADELERWFREYGDERKARHLAKIIVDRRTKGGFAVSDDLVNAIRAALGPRSGPPDFARLFQAVRIAVNDELGQLAAALPRLLEALEPGGILAVISYHSGEDRLTKRLFRDWARACICPSEQPTCTCRGRPLGAVTPHKAISAGAAEIAANPRARSAHLRVFRKADGG